MAEKLNDGLADNINHLLECSVCLERFKHPKCLPCHHTFCKICIESLVFKEDNIKCPECRAIHTLSSDGVSGLTSNFTMVSLMDISPVLNDHKTGTGIKLAQHACAECGTETIQSDLTPCPHCGDVICPVCSVSHFTNMKASLYKSAQNIYNNVAHIYDAKHKLEVDLLQLKKQSEDIKTEINENVDRFIHELRDRQKGLCQQVDVYVNNACSSLQSEMKHLEAELANRLSLSASIDSALAKLHNNIEVDMETLMSISAQCSEYIDQDKEHQPSSLQSRPDHSVNFVSINAEGLRESILKFGEITTDTRGIDDVIAGIDMAMMPMAAYHERQGVVFIDEDHNDGFSEPRCIAISPSSDRIYVTANTTVQMFDVEGRHIKTSRDPRPRGEVTGLFKPVGIAVNKNGDVIVADSLRHGVVVFGKNLEYRFSFGKHGKKVGQFDQPMGIAVDDTCTIYVCDSLNHRIQVFDHGGQYLRKIMTARLQCVFSPEYLAIDHNTGSIYVTNSNNIYVYSTEGQCITYFSTTAGKMDYLLGICVDDNSCVIFSECVRHQVQVFYGDATFQCRLAEFAAQTTRFCRRPQGLTIDKTGRLFVVDSRNNRVIVF